MPNVAGVEVKRASEVAPLVEKQLQGLGVWTIAATARRSMAWSARARAGSLPPEFGRALFPA